MTDPTVLRDVANAVTRLQREVNAFDRSMGWVDKLTWEEAALVLRLCREQVTLLQAAVGAVEARVIVARREAGVHGDVPVEGVGVVSVSRPKNRKAWDHDALAGQVLDARLLQLEGNIPDPWQVRDWLLSAAHVDYWRTTELKDLGINPDDFCSSEPGRITVKIIHSDAPPKGLT